MGAQRQRQRCTVSCTNLTISRGVVDEQQRFRSQVIKHTTSLRNAINTTRNQIVSNYCLIGLILNPGTRVHESFPDDLNNHTEGAREIGKFTALSQNTTRLRRISMRNHPKKQKRNQKRETLPILRVFTSRQTVETANVPHTPKQLKIELVRPFCVFRAHWRRCKSRPRFT